MPNMDIRCAYCGKPPGELEEYVDGFESDDEYETIEEYVRNEEGTFNPQNGHFACTPCYIRIGMPSRDYPNGWVAP